AGAGGDGGLQVFDVHVERGEVERAAATGDLRLRADLVVPQRFVIPRVVAAEGSAVGRRTEREVERIVEAAEAEALRDLRVQARGVGELVAGHDARGDAVRARGAGLNLRVAGVVLADD